MENITTKIMEQFPLATITGVDGPNEQGISSFEVSYNDIRIFVMDLSLRGPKEEPQFVVTYGNRNPRLHPRYGPQDTCNTISDVVVAVRKEFNYP